MTDPFKSIPFDTIKVGMTAETRHVCSVDDAVIFANASGNHNPLHLHAADGASATVPSILADGLISAVIGNHLPGPGSVEKSKTMVHANPAHPGDELVARVEVTEKLYDNEVLLATIVERTDGTLIASGETVVVAPTHVQSSNAIDLPGLTVRRHRHVEALLDRAKPLPPMPTAVIAPETQDALYGALLGLDHTLITPVLIGDHGKITKVAHSLGRDLSNLEIIDEPDHAQAAARGVAMVRDKQASALMKGHLHTDVLLKAVVSAEGGLRTGRRLSHVFILDVPGYDRLLHVTDGAINIQPDLQTKIDIVQNAIDLAQALDLMEPKVAILSAVEKVNPAIASTLDAAAISKMADRGQIKGGVVDGPLAMDNAIDLEAAKTKGIQSAVAGRADILVAPNMETGNMLAKELIFAAGAKTGGLVVGARCPVILTSRADDAVSRLASCAIAALQNKWMKGA